MEKAEIFSRSEEDTEIYILIQKQKRRKGVCRRYRRLAFLLKE
mgnify:CR=1 FL=1